MRSGKPTIAVLGYTNAGKTSLVVRPHEANDDNQSTAASTVAHSCRTLTAKPCEGGLDQRRR